MKSILRRKFVILEHTDCCILTIKDQSCHGRRALRILRCISDKHDRIEQRYTLIMKSKLAKWLLRM